MDDLISRQAAIEAIADTLKYEDYGFLSDELESVINNVPAADVVEVVRCKDCRWGREACGNIECFADTNVPPEYHGYEWFCPNGERRTDE